jgi:sulfate/thiosulfate transport system substrate-binding protein
MKQFNLLKSAALIAALLSPLATWAADISLPNVSYDPTHELYAEYNTAFAKYWKAQTGHNVSLGRVLSAIAL